MFIRDVSELRTKKEKMMPTNPVHPEDRPRTYARQDTPPVSDPAPAKARKPRVPTKVPHPVLEELQAKDLLLEALPGNFDFDKHQRLNQKDFATPEAYWAYRVKEAEHRLAGFKARYEASRGLGSKEMQKDTARWKKTEETLKQQRDDLRELYAANGHDFDKLMGEGDATNNENNA